MASNMEIQTWNWEYHLRSSDSRAQASHYVQSKDEILVAHSSSAVDPCGAQVIPPKPHLLLWP